MTTPDLLPCPFCGGEGRVVFGQELHYYVGVCKNCNTHSEPRLTEEYAAESWNRRADDVVDALRARVAELETAQRWIPVTERLPKNYQQVLVVDEDKRYFLLWYDVEFGMWSDWQGRQDVRVTHWQLPAPPEEVE